MKTDMSGYGVTELTSEEASATSGGGLFWAIFFGVMGLVGLAAVIIGAEWLIRTRG